MKKDTDKKPKNSKSVKRKKEEPRPQVKTKAQRGLDEFLESKRIERERIEEERKQAKKVPKTQKADDAPSSKKNAPEEKPIVVERDYKTRDLVGKFYGDDDDVGEVEEVVEARTEETFVEETVQEKIIRTPIRTPEGSVSEEIKEEESVPELVVSGSEADEASSDEEESAHELVVAGSETDGTPSEVRQALLDTMKKRGAQEERKLTPKDKEKAEKVKMVLGAAENLYKGTRKATRGTLDFAGGVAKGSVEVATAVTGGVFGLVGQGVLGVVRVAGIGYRGVGALTSGVSKGVSSLAARGEGEEKKGLVGSVASGIAKKTSDFLCIEDGNK
jgi:hypothetical protein